MELFGGDPRQLGKERNDSEGGTDTASATSLEISISTPVRRPSWAAIGVLTLTGGAASSECFSVVRLWNFCSCLALLVGLGASGVACYEMNAHPVMISANAPLDRCQLVIVTELARIGYRPIERVSGDHAIFSRDPSWQQQTPLNSAPPTSLGGVIALRTMKREDGRCVVHLQGESYDCLSSDPSIGAFRRCELTAGAPPDIGADIRTVAAAFRERF